MFIQINNKSAGAITFRNLCKYVYPNLFTKHTGVSLCERVSVSAARTTCVCVCGARARTNCHAGRGGPGGAHCPHSRSIRHVNGPPRTGTLRFLITTLT